MAAYPSPRLEDNATINQDAGLEATGKHTIEETQWCEAIRSDPTSTDARSAFDQLYRRYLEQVTLQARSMTRDPKVVEDLVSGTFSTMLQALVNGAGPTTSVLGYLLTSMRSEMIRLSRVDAPLVSYEPVTMNDLLTETTSDFSEALADRDQIARAFNELSTEAKQILWLLDVEQRPLTEVAEQLDISLGTARVRSHRSRKRLGTLYLQQYVEASSAACSPVASLLAEDLRSELGKRNTVRVEQHLETCKHCSQQSENLKALSKGLRSFLGPALLGGATAGVAATYGANATGAAAAAPGSSKSAGTTTKKLAVWGGLAASAVLIAAGFLLLMPNEDADPSRGIPEDLQHSAVDPRPNELGKLADPTPDREQSAPGQDDPNDPALTEKSPEREVSGEADDTTPNWKLR